MGQTVSKVNKIVQMGDRRWTKLAVTAFIYAYMNGNWTKNGDETMAAIRRIAYF